MANKILISIFVASALSICLCIYYSTKLQNIHLLTNYVSNNESSSEPEIITKVFDISCGCSGTKSIFKFFTHINKFNGSHYNFKVNNKRYYIGDTLMNNYARNEPILTQIPSDYQYLSDLKLCSKENVGIQVVKKLQKEHQTAVFIMLVRPLSNYLKCSIFLPFPNSNSMDLNNKVLSYEAYNSTRKDTATKLIGLWFNYHCNIIDYFRNISQAEKLIIFDIERDSLSLLKDAFNNISEHKLIGNITKLNTLKSSEQSANIYLQSFCELYLDTKQNSNPAIKSKTQNIPMKKTKRAVFDSKIFDISAGCAGTSSLFWFFKQNGFEGKHYKMMINQQVTEIGELIASNYKKNVPLLSDVSSEFQLLSDLKLLWKQKLGVNIVKKLDEQYTNSIFILLLRPLSNWVKCHTFFPLPKPNAINRFDPNSKWPKYKLLNMPPKDLATKQIGLYFYYHCNIMHYFRNESRKLIIFDMERDNLSMLKAAFYNLTGYKLSGDLPNKNHHSDHSVNSEEASAKIPLKHFCDLYIDRE